MAVVQFDCLRILCAFAAAALIVVIAPLRLTLASDDQIHYLVEENFTNVPNKATSQVSLRLGFVSGKSEPNETDKARIIELSLLLLNNMDYRVAVFAYARQPENSAYGDPLTLAQRLSLFRALAVRRILMQQGIKSTRIDIRALGPASDDGPADRVDIYLSQR